MFSLTCAAAVLRRITPSLCNSAACWASGSLGEQLTRAGVGALLGRDSKARTSRLRCFLAAFKPLFFFSFSPVAPGRPILLVNKSHRVLLSGIGRRLKSKNGGRERGQRTRGPAPASSQTRPRTDGPVDATTGRRRCDRASRGRLRLPPGRRGERPPRSLASRRVPLRSSLGRVFLPVSGCSPRLLGGGPFFPQLEWYSFELSLVWLYDNNLGRLLS